MNIVIVYAVKILNFKSARSLLSTCLVRAARTLFCEWRLNFGGAGINDSEVRRVFSDLSQYVLF
jgi:hypothetical protein